MVFFHLRPAYAYFQFHFNAYPTSTQNHMSKCSLSLIQTFIFKGSHGQLTSLSCFFIFTTQNLRLDMLTDFMLTYQTYVF